MAAGYVYGLASLGVQVVAQTVTGPIPGIKPVGELAGVLTRICRGIVEFVASVETPYA